MTYNEAEIRYFLIDPVLREKGYNDHQWLKLETPALVEPTETRGFRQLAISQEDLARELSGSYATVNRWKSGRAKPSPLAMKQIKDLLRDLGKKGRDLLEAFFGEEA